MFSNQKGRLQFSVIAVIFIVGMFSMGFSLAPLQVEKSFNPVAVRNDVVFVANGGSFDSTAVKIIAQNIGAKYKLPEEPTINNGTFVGWYTKNGLGDWESQITASTIVKADHQRILFARWKVPDISVEADLILTGTGSGWHGKLVLYNPVDETAISFGIQHDKYSALGFSKKDALMFECVFRPEPVFKAFKEVEPGVKHRIRLEYDKNSEMATGYCDGVKIAEMPSPKMDQWFVVGLEASSRWTGDTVDARFENIIVYANERQNPAGYWTEILHHGDFHSEPIDNGGGTPPRSEGAAFASIDGYHLWGTADLPGGDWDSYAAVGAKMMMNIQ